MPYVPVLDVDGNPLVDVDGEQVYIFVEGEVVVEHVEVALSRLRQQYRERANIEATLSALVRPIVDTEAAYQQLLLERQIDTAVDKNLDVIGDLVGQPREGQTDDVYRRLVRARIAANRSSGTTEDLLTVMRLILDDADDNSFVTRLESYQPAGFVITSEAATSEELAGYIRDYVYDAKAAGVAGVVMSSDSEPEDRFTFGDGADQAVRFGDGDTYASITDAAQTGIGGTKTALTVAWWEYLPAMRDNAYVISKYASAANNRSWWFGYDNAGAGGAYRMKLGLSSDGISDANAYYEPPVEPLRVWRHVCYVFDGAGIANSDRIKLYIDGVLTPFDSFAGTIPTTLFNSNGDFRLGSLGGVSGVSVYARMNHVRIWSAALTKAEILRELASASPVRIPNLEASYALNSDFNDYSPNANHLTATGSPTFHGDGAFEDAVGKGFTGQALAGVFNGTSSFLQITDAAQTGLDLSTDLTIRFRIQWTEETVGGGAQSIVAKWGGGGDSSWLIQLIDPGGQIRLLVSSDGTNNLDVRFPFIPVVGEWYTLTFTFASDGAVSFRDSCKLYVDDTEIASVSGSGTLGVSIWDGADPVRVGQAFGQYFGAGRMEDVAIWSRALDSAEVVAEYESSVLLDTRDLEAWWRLNGDGVDSGPNGNDLTESAMSYDYFDVDAEVEVEIVDGGILVAAERA